MIPLLGRISNKLESCFLMCVCVCVYVRKSTLDCASCFIFIGDTIQFTPRAQKASPRFLSVVLVSERTNGTDLGDLFS